MTDPAEDYDTPASLRARLAHIEQEIERYHRYADQEEERCEIECLMDGGDADYWRAEAAHLEELWEMDAWELKQMKQHAAAIT